VARVVAFIPDLLFGSNVVGALQAGGHEVKLASAPAADADVLVVDLTTDAPARIEATRGVMGENLKTLAFYSHVEADVRAAALEAGFDLVVPRSRMAREGAALVDRLAGS
jgi:DNA-binding NarL/FixJ family response regulator